MAKGAPRGIVCTAFSAPKIPLKYEEPAEQAEYAYGLIRNEVSG
ncbi:MAG: hypothetical protein SOU14_03665 [Succiniclasticum sp.]|nr:hypothetical protein [Succiniclasticum sp.]